MQSSETAPANSAPVADQVRRLQQPGGQPGGGQPPGQGGGRGGFGGFGSAAVAAGVTIRLRFWGTEKSTM